MAYVYCGNEPQLRVDPLGLSHCSIHYVNANNVIMRAGPTNNSAHIRTLHTNTQVGHSSSETTMGANGQRWDKVVFSGSIGWIPAQYLQPTQVSTNQSSSDDRPILTQGSSGAAVTDLQTLLSNYGYLSSDGIDGDFGPITEDAVKLFQTVNGLDNDGIVGPLTWETLLGNPIALPGPLRATSNSETPPPTAITTPNDLKDPSGYFEVDKCTEFPAGHAGGVWGVGAGSAAGWGLVFSGEVYYVWDTYGNKAILGVIGGGGGLIYQGIGGVSAQGFYVAHLSKIWELEGAGTEFSLTLGYIGGAIAPEKGLDASVGVSASLSSGASFTAEITYSKILLVLEEVVR